MSGLPVSGDTVFRLFMPNQHSADNGTSDNTHANPAFWIQVGVPAAILPKIQPLSLVNVIGSPPMPAIAVSVQSSAWVNGRPRLSICTVMMPHMPHTAKPHSSAGTEIHRLR